MKEIPKNNLSNIKSSNTTMQEIENDILHILNRQLFKMGVISEELYLKAEVMIDR